MSADVTIPPLRDLPHGQLTARRNQLLEQIGAEPRRLSGSRRRLALTLATVVALGVLFATPAFGLRGAIIDLFGRSDVTFSDATPAASVIKRDFAEMSNDAPIGMSPKALVGQARLVGSFKFGEDERRVWVAPTATGSFCFSFEGVSGGCHSPSASYDPLTFDGGFVLRGSTPATDKMAGRIFDPSASRLEIEFEDGRTRAPGFVYVSEPINAGFYMYKPTEDEQQVGHRPTRLLLTDAQGQAIAEERFNWEEQASRAERLKEHFATPKQLLPSQPPLEPSPPLQEATAAGATVTIGSNGAAVFDISALEPGTAAMIDGPATFSCYRVTETDSGALKGHQYGHYGRHTTTVGVRLFKHGTVDACDIAGGSARTWPDKLGSRNEVEFSFNERGRSWLADRAAARDLALFVSSPAIRDLRQQPATELEGALGAHHARVVELGAGEPPADDKIGFTLTDTGVTFTRTSDTGQLFTINVENGKVASHTLGELARVR
jgi:hypothetical protein